MEEFFFIGLCLVLGLISGFIGGLLGIGGGVIIVPALVLLYDLDGALPTANTLLTAVATSLACIIFTSASAAYAQYQSGRVIWALFRQLIPFLLLGSFAAGFIGAGLSSEFFRGFIGVFLSLVALVMLSNWQPHPQRRLPGAAGTAGIGFAGGITAGLAGIAGGNVIVPTLIYFNTPAHNATATSSALGVPIAMVGTLGYLSAAFSSGAEHPWGYIDLRAAMPIIIGALIAAPRGVRTAHRVPGAKLKRLFGALLLVIAARMLYSVLN